MKECSPQAETKKSEAETKTNFPTEELQKSAAALLALTTKSIMDTVEQVDAELPDVNTSSLNYSNKKIIAICTKPGAYTADLIF